jgi:hypothetical protein
MLGEGSREPKGARPVGRPTLLPTVGARLGVSVTGVSPRARAASPLAQTGVSSGQIFHTLAYFYTVTIVVTIVP